MEGKVLTTQDLYDMPLSEVTSIADSMAAKMQFFSDTGKDKENPEKYKRIASELYHLSEIIENRTN